MGPRFFGFVTGGSTPAAIAGDWLAAAVDQNGADPGDSAACGLAYEALDWLKDLFHLPRDRFDGAFTSGATQANLMGLLSGLHSKAREMGHDVGACGLQALPPIRIYGGAPHSSIMHALTALGIGRDAHVRIDCFPNSEAVDPDALARVLEAEDDTPATRIITASVATVTGTDFDDLNRLADIAEAHDAWLHADGAFGAFVRCVPELADYAKGLERADSICADGHKWLNVPYDCGFYFTRDIRAVESAWGPLPPYLDIGETTPIFMNRMVENSQRVRGFPAWATLRAYGAEGVRGIVRENCRHARILADWADAAPGFELLHPVKLNVVCFRAVPPEGSDDAAAKRFNEAVRDHVNASGLAYLTPGAIHGKSGIRAAFSNWMTTEDDVLILCRALETARSETERVL